MVLELVDLSSACIGRCTWHDRTLIEVAVNRLAASGRAALHASRANGDVDVRRSSVLTGVNRQNVHRITTDQAGDGVGRTQRRRRIVGLGVARREHHQGGRQRKDHGLAQTQA